MTEGEVEAFSDWGEVAGKEFSEGEAGGIIFFCDVRGYALFGAADMNARAMAKWKHLANWRFSDLAIVGRAERRITSGE